MVTASMVFGALVRALGVYFVCNAGGDVLQIVLKNLKVPTGSLYPVATDWIGLGWYSTMAVILLAGANFIVRLVYRQDFTAK
jgi:hypothetical protein